MIALILQNRIARAIGGALVALLALLGWGAAQKRKGAVAARNERAAADAKADAQAHERINHADTGTSLDDDARRQRLREFAAKHGAGSNKAGGR
jgi:hypothetical protein